MSAERISVAMERLKALQGAWHEVQLSQGLRDTAVRLLRVHPLRAADAMQLSAAIIASDREPAALEVVTLDTRLAGAARREGFSVIGPEQSADP